MTTIRMSGKGKPGTGKPGTGSVTGPPSSSDNVYNLLDRLKLKINDKNDKIQKYDKEINNFETESIKIEINKKLSDIISYRKDNDKIDLTTKDIPQLSVSIDIDDIKREFNSEYENLTNSVKTLKDTINLVDLLMSNNKLETLFNIKNKKIIDIYQGILNIKITDNTLNSINKTKEDIEKKIDAMNKFFKKDIKNDFINEVYKEFKLQESTDIITESKTFFDTYKKYYTDLITSINLLLDKINNQDIVLITDINENNINNFNRVINDKIKKYNSIISTAETSNKKNTKKGKITFVLPYTDILYASISQLLVIIDFLSYFYRPK